MVVQLDDGLKGTLRVSGQEISNKLFVQEFLVHDKSPERGGLKKTRFLSKKDTGDLYKQQATVFRDASEMEEFVREEAVAVIRKFKERQDTPPSQARLQAAVSTRLRKFIVVDNVLYKEAEEPVYMLHLRDCTIGSERVELLDVIISYRRKDYALMQYRFDEMELLLRDAACMVDANEKWLRPAVSLTAIRKSAPEDWPVRIQRAEDNGRFWMNTRDICVLEKLAQMASSMLIAESKAQGLRREVTEDEICDAAAAAYQHIGDIRDKIFTFTPEDLGQWRKEEAAACL